MRYSPQSPSSLRKRRRLRRMIIKIDGIEAELRHARSAGGGNMTHIRDRCARKQDTEMSHELSRVNWICARESGIHKYWEAKHFGGLREFGISRRRKARDYLQTRSV